MGCATQIWWGGGGPPSHATVRLDAEGHAYVVTGIQDIGTGTLTSAQIVAAEELGLPLDSVRVVGGDTRHNVYGPVAGGSQTTPSVMPAVRSAAAKVRKTLLQLAGDVFEIAAGDLEVRDGRIRSSDGAIDAEVTEVTEKLGNATIDGSGSRGPNPDGFVVHTFGCQIAQVAVDARPRRGAGRADRRRPRRRADRQPPHGVEPGRGRRAAGDGIRADGGASSSTRRPAFPSPATSTTTRSPRSRTCPRS